MDFEFYTMRNHAIVKRYNGENTEVIIPEQYNGVPVTHIANDCFAFSNITTVFGKSIECVGSGAFNNCTSLISICFPVCVNIENNAFVRCSSLASVNFPVCKYVDYNAFRICTRLTNVNLPACSYIGEGAFYSCTSLTRVNSPVCEYIGTRAFYGCTSLIKRGKYKATKIDLTCRDFKYEIGKLFEEDSAILCKKGFHYVENFYDIFNYYHGKLGEDLRIFEVDAEEISDEHKDDSKRVCKKIKLVNEIKSYQEIF